MGNLEQVLQFSFRSPQGLLQSPISSSSRFQTPGGGEDRPWDP